MAEQVEEDACVQHYVALLPYKPKRWVTCHQLQTLDNAVLLMEAYTSAEAGVYLRKNLQCRAAKAKQNKHSSSHKPSPGTTP